MVKQRPINRFMKKRNLLFAAIFAMVMFAGLSVKAQNSVFSYAYQGTTLYYIINSNQQARVVPPLYPHSHWNADSTEYSTWYGYAKPQGDVVVPDTVVFNGEHYPVVAVGNKAFWYCDSVTSVTLPATVNRLGKYAFGYCSLESITMPGVTSIDSCCFCYASSLTSADVPSGVTKLPFLCFTHCSSLQSVTLPESLTTIGVAAFQWCTALQSITIPESLISIEHHGFYRCTALQSITLPDNLTSIEDLGFFGCTSLQSVNLPDNLTTLGYSAFSYCENLQSIDIPGSVSDIEDWCFYQCRGLVNVTLHEGTETIDYCAFRECYNLTTINYPSTLVEIGDFSFQYDTSLTSPLILPEGFTYIGLVAFGDCSSMVTARLPGSIGEVSDQVFWGCTSLTTVTIEEGITAIGEAAFYDCPNLDTVFVNCIVPPSLGAPVDSVFCTYNATIVVPCGSQNAYMNDPIWGCFSEIIEDCGVGIQEANMPNFTIRVANSCIVVDGAEGEIVRIFDISGRQVNNSGLSNGVYIVKVGNYPAKKVVVSPTM